MVTERLEAILTHTQNTPKKTASAWLCIVLAALVFAGVVALVVVKSRPIQLTDRYGNADITYAANQTWSLFPDECLEITWTTQNVASTTFYPTIEPGIVDGDGVRSVFFTRIHQPGISITEDARGGTTEIITSTEPQTRTETACIDFTSEPKLRVHFMDGTSKSYKLGLDSFFLRLEVWLLLILCAGLISIASVLLKSYRFTLAHTIVWSSTALLSFYALAFFRQGDFLAHYAIDALIFLIVWATSIFISGYSILYPRPFNERIHDLKYWPRLPLFVVIFWLWALSFGYFDPDLDMRNELFWLPFFLGSFVVGIVLLWWTRPQGISENPRPLNTVKTCLQIALFFALLSLARDALLIRNYSITTGGDTISYIKTSQDFLEAGKSTGIPKRIFPYLVINFLTKSGESPVPIVIFQSVFAAVAVGMLTYVLSRKHLALGIAVGLLLALNLSWGMYNRLIMSESGFLSFNIISFAMILWHVQRKSHIPYWELFICGVLYGWTLLFRGTGLPLILPIALIYGVVTRTWLKSLAVFAGFGVFLLMVGGYNQWRYGEFGLIGPQSDTLASALFSYHLFSPENGATSQQIDDDLRQCMGYLDYDDVPRSQYYFIFDGYNPCLLQNLETDQITDLSSKALRELILHNPFEFARVLIQEAGIGLRLPATYEFQMKSNQLTSRDPDQIECKKIIVWCEDFKPDDYPPDPMLIGLNQLITIPSQLYLAVNQITSQTPAVMLFAFLMLSGFLWVMTNEKLLVSLSVIFIFYQLGTVAIVHNFIPRYGLVLGPFFIIISALAFQYLSQQLHFLKKRPNRSSLIIIALILGYIAWSNQQIRTSFTMPVVARTNINLFQKYGMSDVDFGLYSVLKTNSTVAFSPEGSAENSNDLRAYGLVIHSFDLSLAQQASLRGWVYTRLPGYLRDMGITHLMLNENQWGALPPADQAILNDPSNYRLLGEWQDGEESRRLYTTIGDSRSTYPVYEGAQVIIFEQPDLALDVYRLDENRNGVFVIRIPRSEISDAAISESESGWTVQFKVTTENGYQMVISDENDQVIDDAYVVNLP